MLLMDPEPTVTLCKIQFRFFDVLSDRTLMNFEFRQTLVSQDLIPPLLKALLLKKRGFILFLGPVIFRLLKIREESQ